MLVNIQLEEQMVNRIVSWNSWTGQVLAMYSRYHIIYGGMAIDVPSV